MKITFVLLVVISGALSSVEVDREHFPEIPDVDVDKAYKSWSAVLVKKGNFDKLVKKAGGPDVVKSNFKITYELVKEALEAFETNSRQFWQKLNHWAAFDLKIPIPQSDDRILNEVEPIHLPPSLEKPIDLNFDYHLVKPVDFIIKNTVIPRQVDWRIRNVMSWPPDYHPNCNASYPFAVAATIEAHARFHLRNKFEEASRQQFLDCIFMNDGKYYKYNPCNDDRYGFNGPPDAVVRAYKFAALNGMMKRQDYIDNEGKDHPCIFNKANLHYKINGFVMLPKGEEGEIALMVALANFGPVTVSFDGEFDPALLRYGGGIYDYGCTKGKTVTMVVVGYGEDNGRPYWLLQNNWGNWGQFGFIKIARHHLILNNCDLTQQAMFPIIGDFKTTTDYEDKTYWDNYEASVNTIVKNRYAADIFALSLPNWPSIWGTDPRYNNTA